MAQNIGKKFENNFKASMPDDVFYYRLKDSAQSFYQSNNLRFSSKNPCDAFLYKYPMFVAIELKNVASTSISFERNKTEKGVIHFHQIEALRKFASYKGIVAGFVLNFRHKDGTEICYFLHIKNFDKMIENINKKSFNEKDLLKNNPIVIENIKKRTNYTYNVSKFLQDARSVYCNIDTEE